MRQRAKNKATRLCKHPGCRNLTTTEFCDTHLPCRLRARAVARDIRDSGIRADKAGKRDPMTLAEEALPDDSYARTHEPISMAEVEAKVEALRVMLRRPYRRPPASSRPLPSDRPDRRADG